MLALLVLIMGSITTLLLAANEKNERGLCSSVAISIKPETAVKVLTTDDLLLTIEKVAGTTLPGRTISSLPLPQMEEALEKHSWIKDAQLYFDSRNQLHVVVEERVPIARILNTAGQSFYIDSEGRRLEYIQGKPLRLPVVTGFTAAKKWKQQDSLLLMQTRDLVSYISSNPFWKAQVGQIDITASGIFELIPVIGDGVIRLGRGEHFDEKFHRLNLFYQQVLRKAGLNKYAAIDVQFQGQVVAVKKGSTAPVDSAQLKNTIEAFLKQKQLEQEKLLSENQNILPEPADINTSEEPTTLAPAAPSLKKPDPELKTDRTSIPEKPKPLNQHTVPVKTKTPMKPARAEAEKPKPKLAADSGGEKPKPKAVMPKMEEKENDY